MLKTSKIIESVFDDKINQPLENRLFFSSVVVGTLNSTLGVPASLIFLTSAIAVIIPLTLSALFGLLNVI